MHVDATTTVIVGRSTRAGAATTGEGPRLEALFRAHYRELVRLASLLVGASAAEDVTQEAFVRVGDRLERLRDPSAALPYLRRAVVNTARTHARRRRLFWSRTEKPAPAGPSAGEWAEQSESRRAVVAALEGLPPRQRECIVLRYWAEMSVDETARALGITGGSVKTHTHRAVETLRERLGFEL